MTNRRFRLASHATPLASCIAALFGLSIEHEALAATTHYVLSCADSGAGTLRDIVADTVSTVSGDTIDFSNVAPCTVTLTTGAIDISQAALTIQAPSGSPVTLSAKYGLGQVKNERLIHHTGTGLLGFSHLNFYAGQLTSAGSVSGGCIYSAGSVRILNGDLTFCYAHSTGAAAYGGAVFAAKQVTMKYATVQGGGAKSNNSFARGGALFGGTGVGIKYSTLSSNQANGGTANGLGGGVYTGGDLAITFSTISGNTANRSAGAVFQSTGGTYAHIYSSTISGNSTPQYIGGVLLQANALVITNSTISFNSSPTTQSIFGYVYAPGLAIITPTGATTLTMQSTIVSNNNVTATSDFDMSVTTGFFGTGTFGFDVASSNNLIRVPGNFAVPADTKEITCPQLGVLRNNGGFTETHALTGNSIAIDNGSNPKNYTKDQRGDGTLYPRVSGPAPDIGAYEVNKDDIVFIAPFEGCNVVL